MALFTFKRVLVTVVGAGRNGIRAPACFSRGWLLPSVAAKYSTTVNYPIQLSSVSKNHASLYRESVERSDRFWGDLARNRLRWMKDFQQVVDCDMTGNKINWFSGGKLNVSVNVLDRHVEKHPDKVALIWERDEPGDQQTVTYKKLLDMTCQIANLLKRDGVKKGDRIAMYMPISPFLVASMLASARIGAVHSVVFAGFSADALRMRIEDGSVSYVITCDESMRGGKVIPLKETVDKAVQGLDYIKRVYVASITGKAVNMVKERDLNLQEAMALESTECPPEPMDSEDMLFMLYTSGSTGKPKGLVHTQAGYLIYAATTQQYVFDYNPEEDIFACMADIGWITGHTYVVYGPLCNGGTTLLFESVPTYPDPGRYWDLVERLKLTHLYTAPTIIRLLLKSGDDWVNKYDRSSLRILGCVGEPLNDEAWMWYNDVVGNGKCTVVDTWFQTETGGIAITPRPSSDNSTPKPGFPMRPFFGVDLAIVDPDKCQELTGNSVSGHLCIKRPWPGMARTIYGNHEHFLDTYYRPYPGFYFTGDGAWRDSDGHYQITGRVDDVINVKGHRIGTAEVESCIDHDPRVAESAVVGYPHDTFGEDIYAFVVLMDDIASDSHEKILSDLQESVKKQIGGFAVPHKFLVATGLPKTRSGKIMRRILKKIAANKPDELGDTSTLADPSVVETILKKHLENSNTQ